MATSIFKEYFRGYEILGEIGRGNARVLKARHLVTGELVAIKHFAFNTDADTLRRFQRESEIMKSIDHDHIVKISDVHLDAELPYIVMQLIEGGDLRRLLKDHTTLDVETVIRLAYHIADALDAIHSKGVVHRDIKPENIMYRRLPGGELHFLLTDFGIAKLREQTTTVTGSSMLTYEYASPEQFNQSKTVAAPTDYYSLGIVLYECLTGVVPFEYKDDDLLSHINRVIECPVPAPVLPAHRFLPASLLELLNGLLVKQTAYRIAGSNQVRHLLQKALHELQEGRQPVKEKRTLRNPVQPAKPKTLKMPALPAVVKGRKKEFLFTILGVVLFGGFMMGMWVVLPHNNEQVAEENDTGTVLPVDSVKLPSLVHRTSAIVSKKRAAHMVHNAVAHHDMPISEAPAPDAGIPLPNGVYYDDFSDGNDSVWDVGRDENSEFKFENGKYLIRGFTDSLSYHATVKFDLDIQKNFSISATATQWGNEPDEAFGLNYCGDTDRDAYFVYYITASGYYAIGAMVNGDWTPIVNWTPSTHIHTDSEMNKLSIEKKNNSISFLINDKVEKVLPFTGGFGNCFGLRVDGAQTVAFHQLIVKGTH